MNMQQNKVSYPHTATDFLQHAAGTLGERGKQYDTGGKQERSMAKIVAAFNAVHDANGAQLTEQQGWTFMMLLKMVRGAHAPHLDSALDAVGYAALYGECVAEQIAKQDAAAVDNLMGETNAGYEQLQDKLRNSEEALRLSRNAHCAEIERNKQLTIRNDELHTELSQALKELTYIRAECAARGEQLHAVRNKYDRLLNLVHQIDHKARLCAPMQDRLDAILKLTANV